MAFGCADNIVRRKTTIYLIGIIYFHVLELREFKFIVFTRGVHRLSWIGFGVNPSLDSISSGVKPFHLLMSKELVKHRNHPYLTIRWNSWSWMGHRGFPKSQNTNLQPQNYKI